jgi:hypothetical protein
MKRLLKQAPPAMIVVFALPQFTNPARTNPPVPPGGDISANNPPPPFPPRDRSFCRNGKAGGHSQKPVDHRNGFPLATAKQPAAGFNGSK